MGKDFLKRQQDRIDIAASHGMDTGYQKCWDLIQLVLRDPEIMGRDTFGTYRLLKVLHGLQELEETYRGAWLTDKESDVLRTKLDAELRTIYGDASVSFEDRYPFVKRIDYSHSKKQWRD